MFELIKRLSRRHELDVISYIIAEEEKFLPALKAIARRVDTVQRDYPWRRDSLSVIPSMIDEFYSAQMEALVKRRLYEGGYDIVQFEYLHMSQYAPAAYSGKMALTEHQLHFLSRKRDFHNLGLSFSKIEAFVSSLKGRIYELKACSKFDKVITMTEQEKRVLKSYLPRLNAESLPMGVDANYFTPNGHNSDNRDMVYVGFFRHRPNVDAALYFYRRILPLIKKEAGEVNLDIVGFDPPRQVWELNGRDGVRVTGYVEDIRPYICGAKVFVMPIRLGMGMRGKLFEAWAMGKAVVSTSIGCEGVDAVDGKDIFIADTPADFAAKAVRLLKDDKLREAMGAQAREKARLQYEWDIVAEGLENIYRKLL
jgi:glycosyltransferase involved in cell wall biosynthesis